MSARQRICNFETKVVPVSSREYRRAILRKIKKAAIGEKRKADNVEKRDTP